MAAVMERFVTPIWRRVSSAFRMWRVGVRVREMVEGRGSVCVRDLRDSDGWIGERERVSEVGWL